MAESKSKSGATPESGEAVEAKPAESQKPGGDVDKVDSPGSDVAKRLNERGIQTKLDRVGDALEADRVAEAQGMTDERVPSRIDGDGADIRTVGNLRVFGDTGDVVELERGSANVVEEDRKGKDGDPKGIVDRNKARRERRRGFSRALRTGDESAVEGK